LAYSRASREEEEAGEKCGIPLVCAYSLVYLEMKNLKEKEKEDRKSTGVSTTPKEINRQYA
jgi:hypothetical protein